MTNNQKPRFGLKRLIKLMTSRLVITCILMLAQLVLLLLFILLFVGNNPSFLLVMYLMGAIIVVAIVNDDSNPMYKIAWLIPVMVFPIFGVLLYLIFSKNKTSKRVQRIFKNLQTIAYENMPNKKDVFDELKDTAPEVARQASYIHNTSYSPIFKNTQTRFLSTGEEFFDSLVDELKKAEKFIFIEYFIINFGVMWETVLDILKEKASNGVEVRLMYDDLGTISLLPKEYPKQLKSFGIKTCIFNQFRPSLDSFLNYRDHRKITVVDGRVGFTGGANLADEYINLEVKYGHWKDSAVVIKGEAVSSLTSAFLQLWHFTNKDADNSEDYQKYMETYECESDGYVQPFSDGPISEHLTGELAYMNAINNAKRSIKITTPYLILDNEMITALVLAAQSGVDISIITPFTPDKWYVHDVTQSNYSALLKSGIKIYEYTPGFIHSKTIVVDDEIAIVGTVNFDFRSFYLHFENAILMYKSKCVTQVREDFDTMLEICTQVSLEDIIKTSRFKVIRQKILKLFTPLI